MFTEISNGQTLKSGVYADIIQDERGDLFFCLTPAPNGQTFVVGLEDMAPVYSSNFDIDTLWSVCYKAFRTYPDFCTWYNRNS